MFKAPTIHPISFIKSALKYVCWRLDLRIDSRRSISPSETLPNSFAGFQRRKASTPEGRRSLARSPQAIEPTFRGPKDAVARPGAQAKRTRPSKGPGRSPSDTKVMIDHSEVIGGLWRTSAPEGYQASGWDPTKDTKTFVGNRRACKTWIREKVGFVYLSPCNFTSKPAISELYMSWKGAD